MIEKAETSPEGQPKVGDRISKDDPDYVDKIVTDEEAAEFLKNRRANYGQSLVSNRRIESKNIPQGLDEALKFFWANKNHLVDLAFQMHQKVIEEHRNWRNYGVGSAAVVYNKNTGETDIITGYNEKAAEHGAHKHCGEMKIVEEATQRGFTNIVGIVVMGENQEDPSGFSCTTLHPCRECRNVLSPESGGGSRNGNGLTWDGMPIVTISTPPEKSGSSRLGKHHLVEEIHSLGNLIRIHDEFYKNDGRNPEENNYDKLRGR